MAEGGGSKVAAAAATLVILQGSAVDLGAELEHVATRGEIGAWSGRLCAGTREARARAMASVLATVTLDLERWRLGW